MALTDILAKIKAESEAKATELKAEFDKKRKEMEDANAKLLTENEKEIEAKLVSDSAKIKEKAGMEAEMEAKNALLNEKRKFIERTMTKAMQSLAASERYEDLLASMMRNTDMESAEVVPARGKEDATRSAISKSGKNFTLASDSVDITGGFILKTGKVEIDSSFDTIIGQQLRQDLEIELNKLLFV